MEAAAHFDPVASAGGAVVFVQLALQGMHNGDGVHGLLESACHDKFISAYAIDLTSVRG